MNKAWVKEGMKVRVEKENTSGFDLFYKVGDLGRIIAVNPVVDLVMVDFTEFPNQGIHLDGKWYVAIDRIVPIYESEQQAFELVVTHLLHQGKKSQTVDGGACLYRGPEATMCAVGVCLPDSLYDEHLEGMGAEADSIMARINPLCDFLISPSWTRNFFSQLQNIHDNRTIENWVSDFKDLALDRNLNIDFMKSIESSLLSTSTEVK